MEPTPKIVHARRAAFDPENPWDIGEPPVGIVAPSVVGRTLASNDETVYQPVEAKRLLIAHVESLGLRGETAKEEARRVWYASEVAKAPYVTESDLDNLRNEVVVAALSSALPQTRAAANTHGLVTPVQLRGLHAAGREYWRGNDDERRSWLRLHFGVSSFKDLREAEAATARDMIEALLDERRAADADF